MTANIHEPTHARAVTHVRAVGKDTRQKPFAGRWITPVDTGDPIPATSPDYTPELQNNFVQVIAPKQKWQFRLRYDGDLQFQGTLNVSAAVNGDIAITLPGYIAEEPYYSPDRDQGYTTQVTTDGVTLLNAVAHVDASTGDVTVSWLTPGLAIYEIKVFEDVNDVTTGDDKFVWEIPEDLDQAELIKVEAFITTAGGSTTQIQLRHSAPCAVGTDILSTKITIDSGDCNSKDAAVQPAISGGSVAVAWGDHLHIDVDAAGSGAKGLGLIVTLTPSPLGSVALRGVKGDPGGATSFRGAWTTSTSYQAGDIVTNNNTVYIALQDNVSSATDEPGVGINSDTFWEPFFDLPQKSAIEILIDGRGYPIDTGIKGVVEVPYNCEVVASTMLADIAGSIVIDIWKDTYGSYPPTNADSITAAAPPTISGGIKTQDTSLAGWTTTLNEGDMLAYNVDSCTTITRVTLSLKILRS